MHVLGKVPDPAALHSSLAAVSLHSAFAALFPIPTVLSNLMSSVR